MSKRTNNTNPQRLRCPYSASLAGVWAIGLWYLLSVTANFSLTGLPLREMSVVLLGLNVATYVWVRQFSDWRFSRQFFLLGVLFFSQIVFFGFYHVEGLTGNGRPIFAWRGDRRSGDLTLFMKSQGDPHRIDMGIITEFDFPSFRGPNRDGALSQIAMDWSRFPAQPMWSQRVGRGWSSFAIVGDFGVTMEQHYEAEMVICYHLPTGQRCWYHASTAHFEEFSGGDGPRATPAIDHGRVYSLGATGILNCLDGSNGELIWSVNILEDNAATNCLFGMAGSPLIMDDLVVVSPGGPHALLVAYDKAAGEKIWAAGNGPAAYSSPQPANFSFGKQILNLGGNGLTAHDPKTGDVLWRYPWMIETATKNNVCQPIAIPSQTTGQPDRVFISSGYGMGCALLAIDHVLDAATGKDSFSVKLLWRTNSLKSKFASAVYRNGFVYGLDEGILTCIDLTDGSRRWKQGRYGHGQLLLIGTNLLIQAEQGDLFVVHAEPDAFEEVGRIPALDGRTWNHPSMSDNYLVVRNDRTAKAYKIDLSSD